MSCTPEEIERKRQIALQKLANRKRSLDSIQSTEHSPAKSKFFSLKTFPPASPSSSTKTETKTINQTSKSNAINQPIANTTANGTVPTGDKITVSFVLISPARFQIITSKYFAPVIDIIKTLSSRCYDVKAHIWDLNLKEYEILLEKLNVLRTHLVINKLPPWVLQMHKMIPHYENQNVCYDFSSIDEELRDTLMPFQEESICFAIKRNGRCFIADEMGLGKTIQALAIAAYYKEDWPLCIITTSSTCESWASTIYKYLPSVPVLKVINCQSGCDIPSDARIIISSYDLMTRRLEKLLKFKCGVLIFDESHSLKNFKTKYYKSAETLAKGTKRVLLLSGTPALSKPSELFTQLSLLDEHFFVNFIEYSKRYCDGKNSAFGWDARGQSNLQELQIVLETRFMIRRTKKTLTLNLPEKLQEVITLDMHLEGLNREQRECLEKLQGTDFKEIIRNDRDILPFFHQTGLTKIPAVCSYLSEILQTEDRKMIIFAHHLKMLDAVEEMARNANKMYIRIDGRTHNREVLIECFQNNPKYVCAILSITAANAGITLTAANLVIFTELHWTPSILAQAEARAHRIGQKSCVTVRYLIAPKTVDDYVWPMLLRKQRTLMDMKLTNETYHNAKCLPCKPTAKVNSPSPTKTLLSYFPKKESQSKECRRVSSPKVNSDDMDDEWNDFFPSNISQLPKKSHGVNDNKENDLFNDDLDEIFESVDIDL